MELILDLVDLAVLNQGVRLIEPPTTYGPLQALLPVKTIEDVEYKIRRGTVTRGIAQYRAFDAPTPLGRRAATSKTTKQSLLPLGEKLMVGEYETIMLQRAKNGGTDGDLADQIYDDAEATSAAIRRRVQRGLGGLLSTGSYVVEENGLTDAAVFDVPASHLDIVPDDLWSDPDSDLFGFLEQIGNLYAADSDDGQRPGSYMTSSAVVNGARKNKQVIRSQWGPLATEGLVSRTQLNEILLSEGLPPLQVDDTMIGGQRVIPADTIIVGPSNPADLGHTVYGVTGQGLVLANSKAVDMTLEDAPGVTVYTMKTDDPPAVYTAAEATCIGVLERPELLMTLKVL